MKMIPSSGAHESVTTSTMPHEVPHTAPHNTDNTVERSAECKEQEEVDELDRESEYERKSGDTIHNGTLNNGKKECRVVAAKRPWSRARARDEQIVRLGFFDPYKSSESQRKICMTLDFETASPVDWFSVGVLVADYPSGVVLDTFQTTLARSIHHDFAPSHSNFWFEHNVIKSYLDQQITSESESEQMKRWRLCQFVRSVYERFPNVRVVGDNLALDIRLIDTELIMHQMPVISERGDGKFVQPTCTTSYVSSVLGMGGAKKEDSIDAFHRHVFEAYPSERRELERMSSVTIDNVVYRKHIPIVDCANTLLQYFKALDLVRFYRRFRLKPDRLSQPQCQSLFHVHPSLFLSNESTNPRLSPSQSPSPPPHSSRANDLIKE